MLGAQLQKQITFKSLITCLIKLKVQKVSYNSVTLK